MRGLSTNIGNVLPPRDMAKEKADLAKKIMGICKKFDKINDEKVLYLFHILFIFTFYWFYCSISQQRNQDGLMQENHL